MKNVFLAATVMALLCTSTSGDVVYAKTTKDTSSVRAIVRSEAARQGVPVSLAMSIANHESGFRCSAVGRHGERGVMQIKPSTARGIGYNGSARGLNDCSTGVYWGMKYLKMAYVKARGDIKRAAFLFNAGLGAKSRNPGHKPYVVALFRKKVLTE
jgi:soluble lytic murein transglycosylase-like protein